MKGNKSDAAVAFGKVDPNAIVASIVDNSMKNSKVKEKKVQLDVLEGIEEGLGASTVKHLQSPVKTKISAASEGPNVSQHGKGMARKGSEALVHENSKSAKDVPIDKEASVAESTMAVNGELFWKEIWPIQKQQRMYPSKRNPV
jgi:hypothetical protein